MTPFTFEEIHINQSTIFLCHFIDFEITQYMNYLSKEEQLKVSTFRSYSRKMEFMASRILRHRIFGFQEILYSEHGAPYIKGKGFISISHCKNWVGIALNHNYSVGLDLEPPRDNILEIGYKFLSENEKKVFNINSKIEVTKIWSAKEALYKLAGRKKIIFKTELLLDKNKNGQWIGKIINPDSILSVNLNIFEHKEIIVSINSSEIIESKRDI